LPTSVSKYFLSVISALSYSPSDFSLVACVAAHLCAKFDKEGSKFVSFIFDHIFSASSGCVFARKL